MAYPSSVHTIYAEPRAKVAFVYSTKDRAEMTAQTFPAVAAASGFDIFWCDGSRTDEGRAAPAQYINQAPQLKEIHYGVIGGPDAAIVYGLTLMLERGYDYVGLIENDILLADGWFQKIFSLFATGAADGLPVGAVSARTYTERVLCLRPDQDYAVMFNTGAGMILLSRAAAKIILETYRTPTIQEIRQIALDMANVDVGLTWDHKRDFDADGKDWTSADWWFDISLMKHGLASLSPIKNMTTVVDPAVNNDHYTYLTKPEDVKITPIDFDLFRKNLQRAHDTPKSPFAYIETYFEDPKDHSYTVFPHQLMAMDKEAFQGKWKLKWRQALGPFSCVGGQNAVFRVPVNSNQRVTFMMSKPDDVEAAIGYQASTDSMTITQEMKDDIIFMQMTDSNWQDNSYVAFNVLPEMVFFGVIYDEAQPWMMQPLPFDFSVLARYLP